MNKENRTGETERGPAVHPNKHCHNQEIGQANYEGELVHIIENLAMLFSKLKCLTHVINKKYN